MSFNNDMEIRDFGFYRSVKGNNIDMFLQYFEVVITNNSILSKYSLVSEVKCMFI